MFEILVWFAIEYGKTDYRKVDLSNMTSEDKDIFNKYIKSKSYNDTERNIENETMIQPFTIDNEEFLKKKITMILIDMSRIYLKQRKNFIKE